MSGIAALVFPDGRPVDDETLRAMRVAGARLGADGARSVTLGSAGLVHCLLDTGNAALAEGIAVAGQLAVTADARLDNRDELRAALGTEVPGGASDATLILAAYRRWGEDCVGRFLGDFAFALWDGNHRRLYCARDHIGIRPLLYYRGHGLIAAASSADMLLTLPQIPRDLDERAIADFLTYHLEDTESTLFRALRSLPPAHTITLSAEGRMQRRYWALDPQCEVRLESDEAYAERFRELFTAAVARRMRPGERVGANLSGGLDSTSVACVARNVRRQRGDGTPLPTFTFSSHYLPGADERSYLDAALATGGFDPTVVNTQDIDPLERFDEQFVRTALPAAGGFNVFVWWELFRRARERGVRVLLSGTDGDNVVSHGQGVLAEQFRHGHWCSLRRNVHTPLFGASGTSPRRIFVAFAVYPNVPPWVWNGWARLRGRPRSQPQAWESAGLLRPDLAARTGYAAHYDRWSPPRVRPRSAREWHFRTLSSGVYARAFASEIVLAAPFGIEPRFPFMDRRLVEYCLALPGNQKLHDGWTRFVFRRAMDGVLPPEIQWRTGKGRFGMLLPTALLRYHRAELERFAENATILDPYVDRARLRETYTRFLAQPNNADLVPVWQTYVLGRWLQRRQ